MVKIIADATAGASTITVFFEPPLRTAFSGAAAVSYSQALAYFKMLSDAPQWAAVPGFNTQAGYAIDLVEQWA